MKNDIDFENVTVICEPDKFIFKSWDDSAHPVLKPIDMLELFDRMCRERLCVMVAEGYSFGEVSTFSRQAADGHSALVNALDLLKVTR